MADATHDTIDKSEAPVVARPGTTLATPLLGIVLGLVGTALVAFSFVNGISAALNGDDGGILLYIVLFFVGAALALTAVVLGAVGLVRGGHRVLSFLSLLIGLVPIVSNVAIRLNAVS
ncbi:MAG TPA: hypothetical protein VGO65_10875 [Pseudolysinimonas sp.]|jgi:hypothetical protein|nr:hypothetical protein [Pseudolysinimonas sp.]